MGFSAAHFSVVGDVSERLHGHNYRVALRAAGQVGADGTVVDFRMLKSALRAECEQLDEHMIIPMQSPALRIDAGNAAVEVLEGHRRFVFPRDDVVLLPVINTTCECLAAYLLGAVRARVGPVPARLSLSVEELPGQAATVSE